MEAVDSRDLTLLGRQLVINEAYSLSTQLEQPRGGLTPRDVDISERLYLSGLPYSATETSVRALFQNHGLNPAEVYLPKDRQTGQPRGIGFVSMGSLAEATQAIGALNGSLVEGRSLTVRPAAPRSADPR